MERLHTYRSFKKVNEELSEEDINKNPNTTPEEKEELRIKVHKDQFSHYSSKKRVLENMFEDLETEIDTTTLNKIIEDNIFMRKYSRLLYKKREQGLTERRIEEIEDRIKDIKDDIVEIKGIEDLTDDDQEGAGDKIREKRSEISDLESEISDLKSKLSDNDIDKLLNKWESLMSETIRDLKNGKPLLVSNLSHFM